ncbi:reverse transcriptase domain-containing protein [Falsihalocynthiibacter arcticus]|uniref:Reverse transcriptase domain-containing protein n=1 Tax=Falsihalocynthiibacter arcticus TaxID=1579316 RepID=A0A126V458_9RHOB|nr:hypothetical protein RC74_19085 [Falsihalocynthiibacter arcticus]
MGYGAEGAQLLTSLTTYQDCAPTGAPTSPEIGNIVLSKLDEEMAMADFPILYTRYADDLTFSSQNWLDAGLVGKVERIVANNGFELNRNKTKFMGAGDRMDVTGVVINDKVNFSRAWRNRVRGYLHRVRLNPENYRGERNKVAGLYGSLKALDPEEVNLLTVYAQHALRVLSTK